MEIYGKIRLTVQFVGVSIATGSKVYAETIARVKALSDQDAVDIFDGFLRAGKISVDGMTITGARYLTCGGFMASSSSLIPAHIYQ